MTSKSMKTKKRKVRSRRLIELHAAIDDDLLSLADEAAGAEPRWNRPRKRKISLHVDIEVLEWFKSKGAGYQTRMNRVLRWVMVEGKKREEYR